MSCCSLSDTFYQLSKECGNLLKSCFFRTFCHGPRVQRQTQNPLLRFSRAFTPSFPMGIHCWIKYKESGSRAHTHSDGKHCSCFQNQATHFLLFSNAKSPCALHHFLFSLSQEALHNYRHSLPNGLPAISEVGWRCTVFFFSISQKRNKIHLATNALNVSPNKSFHILCWLLDSVHIPLQ